MNIAMFKKNGFVLKNYKIRKYFCIKNHVL